MTEISFESALEQADQIALIVDYERARRRNAQVRAQRGKRFEDCVWLAEGEEGTSYTRTTRLAAPPEPPGECRHFYWVREL